MNLENNFNSSQNQNSNDFQNNLNEYKRALYKIQRRLSKTYIDDELVGISSPKESSFNLEKISLDTLFDSNELKELYKIIGFNTGEDYSSISRKILDFLDNFSTENRFNRIKRYNLFEDADKHPEVAGILNIYADEVCTENANSRIFNITGTDQEIVDIVSDLFERLSIEDLNWNIVRNMCQYGDDFYIVHPNAKLNGIHSITYIDRRAIDRIEIGGKLIGFAENKNYDYIAVNDKKFRYKFNYDKIFNEQEILYPWRVLHFRIPSTKYAPYGQSILENIIDVIQQLRLLEKAILIARISRAPERRVFEINVGQLRGMEAIRYAYEAVSFLKKKRILELYGANEEKINSLNDIFGYSEDILLPFRAGDEPNKISTLEQLQGANQIEDIEYIRDKIFPGAGIPRQYLFDDAFANANVNLSSKNIPFAKRIKRIQRFNLIPLYKLAFIELRLKGITDEKRLNSFTITMNNPSLIDQGFILDNLTNVWSLISTIKGFNTEDKVFYPDYLIYRDILKMSNEEIVELMKLSKLQEADINPFEVFLEKPSNYSSLKKVEEIIKTLKNEENNEEQKDNFTSGDSENNSEFSFDDFEKDFQQNKNLEEDNLFSPENEEEEESNKKFTKKTFSPKEEKFLADIEKVLGPPMKEEVSSSKIEESLENSEFKAKVFLEKEKIYNEIKKLKENIKQKINKIKEEKNSQEKEIKLKIKNIYSHLDLINEFEGLDEFYNDIIIEEKEV